LATVSAEDRLNNWSQTCTLERGNEVRSLTYTTHSHQKKNQRDSPWNYQQTTIE